MDVVKLKRKVVKIIESNGLGGECKDREDYSGRGMFGKVSSVAITGPIHPCSKVGEELRQLGMSWDSMGRDWVYYTRT